MKTFNKILLSILAFTLLGACCNYVIVQNDIREHYKSTLEITQRLDSTFCKNKLIKAESLLSNKDSAYLVGIQEVKGCTQDILKALDLSLNKMEDRKKFFFDSNVVTFLISFFLAFLVAIFIFLEQRYSERIKEYDKTNAGLKKSIEHNKRMFEISNIIYAVKLIATQLNIELSKPQLNMEGPLNEYARTINQHIEDLINRINRHEFIGLSDSESSNIIDLLNQINALTATENIIDNNFQYNQLVIIYSMRKNLKDLINRIEQIPAIEN